MKEDLKARTKQFAVETLRFCECLPPGEAVRIAGRQLMRAATSVGANYRAACRAKSRRDFIAKLGLVEEEADETRYWLEIIKAVGAVEGGSKAELHRLHVEANELLAIVVASIRTAKRNS